MSSTTDTSKGQALVFFVLGLTTVILAAALAFDAGLIILERRDQQNAADAAAMAGARYVTTDQVKARTTAEAIATDNGYTHGAASQLVQVNIPPTSGQFINFPNAIQVEIRNTRPSIFAGIMGVLDWDVSARATAAQIDGAGAPFSILALHETQCEAILVSGNGDITAAGTIQVNSDCPNGALKRQGGGDITVTAGICNVDGDIQDGGGSGLLDCRDGEFENSYDIPDPLRTLPDVPKPALAAAIQPVGVQPDPVPDGCPGSSAPATEASPSLCQFPSSYAGTSWRLSPGLYPGGIKLQAGTFYLNPGIYWLGGGGLSITGNGTDTMSVDGPASTTFGGGVLFFNSSLPAGSLPDQPHPTPTTSAFEPIFLNGAQAQINLRPLQPSVDPNFAGLVLYQDRHDSVSGDDITINGSDSDMEVSGTIYAPEGDVKVNGSAGRLELDQIIALTFKVNGAPGSQMEALKEPNDIYRFYAAGLVE